MLRSITIVVKGSLEIKRLFTSGGVRVPYSFLPTRKPSLAPFVGMQFGFAGGITADLGGGAVVKEVGSAVGDEASFVVLKLPAHSVSVIVPHRVGENSASVGVSLMTFVSRSTQWTR